MRQEAAALRAALPALIAWVEDAEPTESHLVASALARVMHASEALVPEIDMTAARVELAALGAHAALAA